MTLTDPRHDHDTDPADGLSRRSLLARSAASGLGIVLSGSVPGLFGAGVAEAAIAGYGPLVGRSGGDSLAARRASRTRSSPNRA